MAKLDELDPLTELDETSDLLLIRDSSAAIDKKTTPANLFSKTTVGARLSAIEEEIPDAASSTNQLADKEYVDDKIVQSDWDEDDEDSSAYIKNKPSISVDDALSTSSENSLQNKVITANLGTLLCSDAQATTKAISISGVSSYFDGLTVKVCFLNGHSGSSFTLNLNSLGAKTIYVNKNGSAVAMTSHAIDSVNWFVQKYTTLELIYSSTIGGWLILGNPEVLSGSDDSSSYVIKANGLITQRGHNYTVNTTYSFPVSFSTVDSYVGISCRNSKTVYQDTSMTFYHVSASQFYIAHAKSGESNRDWIAEGF